MLCQLSYIGPLYLWRKAVRLRVARYGETAFAWLAEPKRTFTSKCERRLERETGIEPATNSLEGCDSTTELLPPPRLASCRFLHRYGGKPPFTPLNHPRANRSSPVLAALPGLQPKPVLPSRPRSHWPANRSSRDCCRTRAKVGGEGRVRTSVARWAADLQSAAIDRSATSPLSRRSLICWSPCFRRVPEDPLRTMNSGAGGRRGSFRWSWRRDLNPRPADYKSAALPD